MAVFKLDKLAFFIVVMSFLENSETYTVDCSAGQSSDSDLYCYKGFNFPPYYVQYYCRSPYACCTNGIGCCFYGGTADLYTSAELVGIILNSTAIITVALLVLVICGATYCNNKDDTSHIFDGHKK